VTAAQQIGLTECTENCEYQLHVIRQAIHGYANQLGATRNFCVMQKCQNSEVSQNSARAATRGPLENGFWEGIGDDQNAANEVLQ